MVSTATSLASNRRKLRLAAAAAGDCRVPTSAAARREMPSPTTTRSPATASPPGTPTRSAIASDANDGGLTSLSPVSRIRVLAATPPQRSRSVGQNAATASASEGRPQRLPEGNDTPFRLRQQLEQQKKQLEQQKKQLLLQQQLQHQQQQLQQPMHAPLSASHGEGPIAYLGNSTSRGRSRRSRAATRRGVGVAGQGDGREGLGGSSSNRGQPIREEEQEDTLSSMSSSAAGGGGDNANAPRVEINGGRGGAHQMMDAHHRHRHHIHRTAHHNVDEHGHSEEPNHSSSSSSSKLALNLHVAHSVDSDDNGTCFNSIGTTTPRLPSPRHVAVRNHAANAGGGHGDSGQIYQPHFHEELRLPNGEASAVDQERVLSSNTNNHRRNGMRWNTSDTLSPLHENSKPSASSTSSNSSTYAKNGKKSHRHQDEFGSTQQLLGGGAKANNIGSIWDRPEEMISKSNNSSVRYKPPDYGSAYSEFDRDGSSSHHGGAGGSGGGGGGVGGWGGASVASNSEVDQKNEKSTVNAFRAVRGERPHRDLGSYKSSVRHNAVSSKTDGGGEHRGTKCEKDAAADDGILNRSNMKAALGVCTAATIGGERDHHLVAEFPYSLFLSQRRF